MSNLSKKTSIAEDLALTVYLGVYQQLIDNLKPVMGQFDITEPMVLDTLRVMSLGDIVVDITSAVNVNTPRNSLRSYLSTASHVYSSTILELMHDVLDDPAAPRYFKRFRSAVILRTVNIVSKKTWSMGDVIHVPKPVIGINDDVTIQYTTKTSIRLRG